MATIMRARFTGSLPGTGHAVLFQTFWRPGTSGGTTADATDILARVRACLFAVVGNLATGTTYTAQSEVDAIEDTSGALTASWTGAVPAVVTGTAAGDAYSPAMAYLVHNHTSLIVGRRFLKGRTYLAVPSEGIIGTGGAPGAGVALNISNAFNGMLTGGSTASFPVVWHRPTKALPAGGTSGPVTAYQCEAAYLGVQRRRRF